MAEESKEPTPIDAFQSVRIGVQALSKEHAVVSFFETQQNYKDGISKEDFIKYSLAFLGCAEIPKPLYDYLGFIYEFHSNGANFDEVYARTDGRAYVDVYNWMVSRYKKGMTATEFENHLIPGYPPGGGNPAQKPKWINIVIKIIVVILEGLDE